MTTALATYGRYLADFEDLERTLPAGLPGWLRDLRREAIARFRELGMPTARKGNEPWKYTNVGPIAETGFRFPGHVPVLSPAQIANLVPWDKGCLRAVFVNGRFSSALSSSPEDLAAGHFAALADALLTDGGEAQGRLATLAEFKDDGFVALNTAFLVDGAFLHVPAGVEAATPLHLVYVNVSADGLTVSYPRTLIVADAASNLTVIESYVSLGDGRCFTDPVTEIVVGEGARVEHYRLMLDLEQAYHIGGTRVRQERDSSFRSLAFATGPAIGRNDLRVWLEGTGGECYLHGLYVTAGQQHIDNYVIIDHRAPHNTSRLRYKGILDEQSHAVFGGTVFVQPGAVKTDAYQEDKNLLLSAEAEVDSKPSLEIYADDVKCGHGATAGAIADDAIFYMLSRGFDPDTATRFLIKGFASEILDTISIESLRRYLEELTVRALPRLRTGEDHDAP